MSSRRRFRLALASLAAIGAFLAAAALVPSALGALLAQHQAPPTTSPVAPQSEPMVEAEQAAIPEYAAAAAVATALPIIDEAAPIPDYARAEFGSAWADVDGNGCNQRQDVLARDLVEVTIDDAGCTVLTGTLHDPYTATTIAFAHDRVGGDSQAAQIDHVVALSAAWQGGAWAWTDEQRTQFANDLDHLLAVDGAANSSKGDSGPSEWMPPNATYACVFALDYATIADEADLAVTLADRDALVRTLTGCAA